MLSFSQEEIVLEYKDKKNLTGFIEVVNHSTSSAFFKVYPSNLVQSE